MKKIKWRHPSVHDSKTWVEDFLFEDKNGKYLAKDKDSGIRVYLKNNRALIIS